MIFILLYLTWSAKPPTENSVSSNKSYNVTLRCDELLCVAYNVAHTNYIK